MHPGLYSFLVAPEIKVAFKSLGHVIQQRQASLFVHVVQMNGEWIDIDADKVLLSQDEWLWEIEAFQESPMVSIGAKRKQ